MSRHLVKGLAFAGSFVVFSTIAGCISTHGIAPQEQRLGNDQLATDAAIQSANRDAKWPSDQWWRAYRDPQLNTWVQTALDNSPTLSEAEARVRIALSMAGVAESAESPQVSADASLMRHKWPDDYFYGPGTLAKSTTWNNNAAIGFTYPLDIWGRDRSNTERYMNVAYMTAAEARMAQLELESNIVRAYIQLSLQYAELDIAEAMLQQQEHILSLAERRLAGGLGTHFEVSEAEVPLPETKRKIDAIEEEIALSRNQIAALAGKGPGAGASIKRPSLTLTAHPGLPSALPLELVGRRPDVVASRWKVAAQAKGVDVARAEFYPNVDLVASLGYSAVGGGMLEFLTGQKSTYSFGPAVSLPIFDGGRRRSQLGQESAGYDAAVAQYNQTLVNALKGISDQLIRMHSMEKQQELAEQSVAAAQKTYDIAAKGYGGGLTDYLSVLNAQTRLFQQQLVAQQVHAARLETHAGLVVALGGGLMDPKDMPKERKMVPDSVPVRPLSER
ncbi:efflux transporter outer membrane subunit [Pseudomonas panipatensis]|uniref:Efflux transporter, outer membrane factor (OMF) lipoprotein, NodT family n=1 Tax=Pseudomonas panipatensis TaxID=428992 RepID=A0A1G8E1E0_9PSED|nr:efflux transporter, outer membrane factor (OMF) lipoprotein, NodT family [Pseudomonas panipatensis]SMP38891.1 efflux transporter, outer membrane factor (OMF) lipoprotein, NodT family [Pseudomonas panipatensis]